MSNNIIEPQGSANNPQSPLHLSVDWSHGELRAAPRSGDPDRHETYYPVTCPQCLKTRYLRGHDARRATMCATCQRVIAGRAGYAAAKAAGHMNVIARIQERQQMNPSRPERIVKGWLEAQGIPFEHQSYFSADGPTWLIDFVIGSLAIEVRGYWHIQTRAAKDDRLAALWPGHVLFIDANSVVKEPLESRTLLYQFIGYPNEK